MSFAPRNNGVLDRPKLSDADAVRLCGLLDRLGCSCDGSAAALDARDTAVSR
jgi:hypothetical protein